MTRGLFIAFAAVLLVGCSRAPENKDAVRQGVMDHLGKTAGLDMNQLNVDVTDVNFKGNEATAKVAIKPKSAPEQGMNMAYTLERRGEKWVVKGRGAGHGGMGGGAMGGGAMGGGGGMGGGMGEGAMPPGHPPTGGTGEKGKGELPAGHPPVNSNPPAAK